MDTVVDIPPRQVRTARRLAIGRNEYYEKNTVWNDPELRDGNPVEDNFVGLMGEIAFACYADLQIDASSVEITDGGVDFSALMDGDEITLDIKTRRKRPDRLWVKEKSIVADYFVLAHIQPPDNPNEDDGWSVEFLGITSKDGLLEGDRVKSDFGFYNRSLWLEELDPIPNPSRFEPA